MLFFTDLRLSTDGLYTVGCPSNGRRTSSISDLLAPVAQTSAGGTAYSRLPWRAVLPHRPHRPTLLHCWPGHSSTHPHLLLFSGDGSRTSKPSYSPPRGQPLLSLPQLRVVPFLGLAIVHRPGALGMAWSATDMHLKWTVRGEADNWVHSRTQGNASLLHAK